MSSHDIMIGSALREGWRKMGAIVSRLAGVIQGNNSLEVTRSQAQGAKSGCWLDNNED